MKPVIIKGILGDNPPIAKLYYGEDATQSLKNISENSVDCVVTSPPYWQLRDYGSHENQIGLESTPEAYAQNLVLVFNAVRKTLKSDGVLWLNLGDTFFAGGSTTETGMDPRPWAAKSTLQSKHTAGSWNRPVKPRDHETLKTKDLVGIPWRVALNLQADGWYFIESYVWAKTAHMPHPVTDRFVASYEMIFLFGKTCRDDIEPKEIPGKVRMNGNVWWISPTPYPGSHFACFPPALPEVCIRASMKGNRGIVLDPFSGSGTTGAVAMQLGHDYVGLDLNSNYLPLAKARLLGQKPPKGNPND